MDKIFNDDMTRMAVDCAIFGIPIYEFEGKGDEYYTFRHVAVVEGMAEVKQWIDGEELEYIKHVVVW